MFIFIKRVELGRNGLLEMCAGGEVGLDAGGERRGVLFLID
jgi:hypothetical protein